MQLHLVRPDEQVRPLLLSALPVRTAALPPLRVHLRLELEHLLRVIVQLGIEATLHVDGGHRALPSFRVTPYACLRLLLLLFLPLLIDGAPAFRNHDTSLQRSHAGLMPLVLDCAADRAIGALLLGSYRAFPSREEAVRRSRRHSAVVSRDAVRGSPVTVPVLLPHLLT